MTTLTNNIITEPFYDSGYEEVGIVSLFNEGNINISERGYNNLMNNIGKNDVNSYIYNSAVMLIMDVITKHMNDENVDLITNAKINVIIPQSKLKSTTSTVNINNYGSPFTNTLGVMPMYIPPSDLSPLTTGLSFTGGQSNMINSTSVIIFFTGTAMRKINM